VNSTVSLKQRSIVKPPRLSKGATLGIVSLSSPVPGQLPRRFARACQSLRDLGYQLRVPEAACAQHRYMAGSVESRVRALVELWDDDGVDAIVSTIGGHSTHQLLEYLPFERFRDRPKAFIGYSDTTALQIALYTQAGLVSFYGPALMPQFGEFGGPVAYTLSELERMLHTAGLGPVSLLWRSGAFPGKFSWRTLHSMKSSIAAWARVPCPFWSGWRRGTSSRSLPCPLAQRRRSTQTAWH
jgi:hypothetical protein